MEVFLDNGRSELLGAKIARGGEGVIHEFSAHPGKFAKIYHVDAIARENKINKMLQIGYSKKFEATKLHNLLAWPRVALYDNNRRFIGFGMDKVSSLMDINELYAYPPKKNAHIRMREKITSLLSLCDAVMRLHQIGVVVGDFNPDNIKITKDYSVKFVDTDNFHLGNSREMRCVACKPGYVAPELVRAVKNTTYAGCTGSTFTVETDNFALAIHIFQMLFNGCHPFFSTKMPKNNMGSVPAPKPIDYYVEKGTCLFFNPQNGYILPTFSLDTSSFPSYLVEMFRRAFIRGQNNPGERPSPEEWIIALRKYRNELKTCKTNSFHEYWASLNQCPYCEADKRFSVGTAIVPSTTIARPTNSSSVNTPVQRTQQHQIAPPVQQVSNSSSQNTSGIGTGLYWFLSVVLSLGIIILFTTTFLKPINYSIVEDSEILSRRSVLPLITSGIIGFIGLFIYSTKWSPRKNNDFYTVSDIFLAVLSVAGFTLLGFFAAALIVKIVDAILKAIVWIIIIIIGIAALGGG